MIPLQLLVSGTVFTIRFMRTLPGIGFPTANDVQACDSHFRIRILFPIQYSCPIIFFPGGIGTKAKPVKQLQGPVISFNMIYLQKALADLRKGTFWKGILVGVRLPHQHFPRRVILFADEPGNVILFPL